MLPPSSDLEGLSKCSSGQILSKLLYRITQTLSNQPRKHTNRDLASTRVLEIEKWKAVRVVQTVRVLQNRCPQGHSGCKITGTSKAGHKIAKVWLVEPKHLCTMQVHITVYQMTSTDQNLLLNETYYHAPNAKCSSSTFLCDLCA